MRRRLCAHFRCIYLVTLLKCTLWLAWMPLGQSRPTPFGAAEQRSELVMQKLPAAKAAATAYITAESPLTTASFDGSSNNINSGGGSGGDSFQSYHYGNITTAFGCPRHSVYSNPWVKDNIALTYSLFVRDGLGSQVQRIMGIFAIAQALGVGYIHSPFTCIGHIGPYAHQRLNRTCDKLEPKHQQQLHRVTTFLSLPNTTVVDTSGWNTTALFKGTWGELAAAVQQAVQHQQPTIIRLEMLNHFLPKCHDLFHHVPSWRPEWRYQQISKRAPVEPSLWLLTGVRPVRIAVHMRRGDLSSRADLWRKRGLSASYFINVVKGISQILSSLHRDYTVEWFTEPSHTPEEREDIARIRREVSNLSVHLHTDLIWNWHQMASADILLMSFSMYSYVPAVINAQGIIVRPDAGQYCRQRPGGCHPSNWLETEDQTGTVGAEIAQEIYTRWGNGTSVQGSMLNAQPKQQQQQQQL